jgi:hypothetical protein
VQQTEVLVQQTEVLVQQTEVAGHDKTGFSGRVFLGLER